MHAEGRAARALLDAARAEVARLAAVPQKDVVFTSGGSEAVSAAIRGVTDRAVPAAKRVVVSAIEHSSVLDAARALTAHGFEIVEVPCEPDGRIEAGAFAERLDGRTALACLRAASNETGFSSRSPKSGGVPRSKVPFLVDAVRRRGRSRSTARDGPPISSPFRRTSSAGRRSRRADRAGRRRDGAAHHRRRAGTAAAAGRRRPRFSPRSARPAPPRRGIYATSRSGSSRCAYVSRRPSVRCPTGFASTASTSAPRQHRQRGLSRRLRRDPRHRARPGRLRRVDRIGLRLGRRDPLARHPAMGYDEEEARGAVRVSLGWSTTSDAVDAFLAALPALLSRATMAGR
jgi:hypothetical protein